jgi:hypothetical protein
MIIKSPMDELDGKKFVLLKKIIGFGQSIGQINSPLLYPNVGGNVKKQFT